MQSTPRFRGSATADRESEAVRTAIPVVTSATELAFSDEHSEEITAAA